MMKQRALILEQLEEERLLKEQRDQEYIEKKYTMLRLLENDTSDRDTAQCVESVQSMEKIQNSLIFMIFSFNIIF